MLAKSLAKSRRRAVNAGSLSAKYSAFDLRFWNRREWSLSSLGNACGDDAWSDCLSFPDPVAAALFYFDCFICIKKKKNLLERKMINEKL